MIDMLIKFEKIPLIRYMFPSIQAVSLEEKFLS